MATIKKNKSKKIVIPICILLVVAIIVSSVTVIKKNKSIETVTLATISTDTITETVSATGEVTSGTVKEYKAGTVATCKEVFVKVGDEVKKDDILATFDTEALEGQISSLQSTYASASKSYSNALVTQKTANAKLASVNKQIPVLEKQLSALKAKPTTQATTKKNTQSTTSPSTTTTTTAPATTGGSTGTFSVYAAPTATADFGDSIAEMVDALSNLVSVINDLTKDIEETNALIKILTEAIIGEIEKGSFDSEVIGEKVGAAVAKAIKDGIVEFIDSGQAIIMIETAVKNVDWETIGKGIAESKNFQVATLEMQLAALYAEKELFTVQADPNVVNAQKQVRDSSKEALDTVKAARDDLAAGWKAAMDGVITDCTLIPGAQTNLLETGIKLENQTTMTVNISLGEYDVHKVSVGMPTTIKTAYGEYTGEVASIAPTATGGSQGSILDSVGSMAGISGLSSLTSSGAGVKCTITVNEPDSNIIAGFDASVDIFVGDHESVAVVPIESMVLEKEGTYVYLYDAEEGTATKTKIETGAISDSAYEIKSGLAIGDQIIATPSTYKDETFKVKVATKK